MRTRYFILIMLALAAVGSQSLAQLLDAIRLEKGTRLMLDMDTPLSSSTAREGDTIYLRVRNDVRVGDKLAIPRGTVMRSVVSHVQPGVVNGKRRKAAVEIQLQEI